MFSGPIEDSVIPWLNLMPHPIILEWIRNTSNSQNKIRRDSDRTVNILEEEKQYLLTLDIEKDVQNFWSILIRL